MELQGKKILFAEDDEFIGDVIVHYLEESGASHVWVKDGADGIEKLKAEKFDLILTDLMMGEVGGVEMVKQAHEMPELANIPVLVLTNLGNDDQAVKEMRALGVTNFFAKSSTSMDKLVSVIFSILKG